MENITISKEVLIGLIVGNQKSKIDFFSDADLVKKIDIVTIKSVFSELMLNRNEKCDDYSNTFILLQSLVYNRHKSVYKEEIADFVLDRLFEYLADTGIC